MAEMYRYGAESPIRYIVEDADSKQGNAAYIVASNQATGDKLYQCMDVLRQHGLRYTPDMVNGLPALEVQGFKNLKQITGPLKLANLVKGLPIVSEPNKKEQDFWSKVFEQRRVQIAGGLLWLSDISYLMSGVKGAKPEEKMAGIFYTIGSTAAAIFGRGKPEERLDEVSEKVRKSIEQTGATVDDNTYLGRLKAAYAHPTSLKRIERFFDKHPSEILNAFYVAGAMMVTASGMKNKQGMDKLWDGLAGGSSALSGLTAIAVKEKPKKEDDAPSGNPLTYLMRWIQEKPNRAAGYGYLVSTVMHGVSALREMQVHPEQKSYLYKMLFVGLSAAAEVILAESHKGGGKIHDEESRHAMVGRVAEVIARQPKEVQGAVIHQISGYLAEQEELHSSEAQLEKDITERVQQDLNNPWALAASNQKDKEASATPAAQVMPESLSWQSQSNALNASLHSGL